MFGPSLAGPDEDFELNRFSLRFKDPALEREYLAFFFDTRRRSLQVGLSVALAVTIAFGFVDRAVRPDALSLVWTLRYGLAVPFLLAASPLVFASRFTPFMRRHSQEMILAVILGTFAILGTVSAVMLKGADYKGVFALLGGWTVVSTTVFGVTRLRFTYVVPVGVLNAVLAIVMGSTLTDLDPVVVSVGYVCLATVTGVGLISCYAVEQYDRTNFAQRRALTAERARTDRLVASMLPPSVARELKRGVRALAQRYDSATVLFADITGFTRLAESIPAQDLVRMLDHAFARFDDIVLRHGAEKVKTIGDAIMCVAGAPVPSADHATIIARIARDLLAVMPEISRLTGHVIALRIGIASGPLLGGVIGTTKPAWDIWGDTVNTAARMESHGEPGRIHVSAASAALLSADFVLEPRGEISVKGKGLLSTFWLVGLKDADETVQLPL